jgi:gliding motility-associated-like protein
MKFKIICLLFFCCPYLNAQDCISFAGTFDLTPIELCLSETALANFQNDQILDDDDLLQFVLHTSDTDELGTIIYTQNEPLLEFISSLMEVETTYYLSAIVGNNNGGVVNLDDPCISVSVGVPVTFLAIPAARLMLDTSICTSTSLSIPIELEGDGPFSFNWLQDGILLDNFTVSGDTSILVTPEENTTFSISNLIGIDCPGVTIGVAQVTLDTVLTIEDLFIECGDSTYVLGFNIFGESPNNLDISGWEGGLFGNSFVSAPIPIDTPYQLFVSNGGPCPATEVMGIDSCGCGILEGGLMNQDLIRVCDNEIAKGQLLEAPTFDERYELYYILHNRPDTQLGQLLGFSMTNEFTFSNQLNYDSIYYISAAVGPFENGIPVLNSNCLLILEGTPIQFLEAPDIPLSLNAPFEICPDQTLTIDVEHNNDNIINFGFIFPNGDTLIQAEETLNIDSISAINNGDYFAFVANDQCKSDALGPVPINVLNCQAFILSGDQSLCEPNEVFIQAAPLSSNCEGIWRNNSGANIDQINSPQIRVENLAIGENQFIWTVNQGTNCENSDTVFIQVSAPPILEDDFYNMPVGENRLRFRPYDNDALNGTIIDENSLQIQDGIELGQALLNEETGQIEYSLNGLIEDQFRVSFTYTICNPVCLGSCDEALITIKLPNVLVGIPEGFTPNNDGVNDLLNIRNIEAYPDNEVLIANRWGDIVYQVRNYTNDRAWDGRFQGNLLPQGVYYLYIAIDGEEPISKSVHLIH